MIVQIQPWIDDLEKKELLRVIESTFVTENKLTAEFEDMIKEITGSKHAVSITNGTMALYCCLKALNISPGDEVIVPNLTFIATANAVIMAGATPVLCEIDPITFCIDIDKAESHVNSKTKAIIPVHLYGQSANMDKVISFSKKHKLKIIEDAAQGIGVKWKGKHVGTLGDLGILSFYGNKTITCGEGGMILTENDELAQACYRLKNHGRDKKGVFIHEHIGFNFSFTEMQAAIGIAQMKKLPMIIERKKQIHNVYENALKGLPQVQVVQIDKNCSPVHWFTSLLVPNAEEMEIFMRENDVQTRRFFYPLHLQPCYENVLQVDKSQFAISEDIYRRGISLPSSYNLTSAEQEKVIKLIWRYFEDRI